MLRGLLLAGAMIAASTVGLARPAAGPRYGSWGVVISDMDRSVAPGDDFFAYVVGSWLRSRTIPADQARAGYTYELPETVTKQLRTIVEEVAARPTTPVAAKVGAAYAAWMDTAGIEARGLTPAHPYLARIDAVSTRSELVQLMMVPGYASPINIGVSVDLDHPTRHTVSVGQAPLGLPTRDYYLLTGAKYESSRGAYRAYVTKIQALAGISDAAVKADRIMALETKLAMDQWTPEHRRDRVAMHNVMTAAQLGSLAPEFDWTSTLAKAGLGSAPTLDVGETTAIAAAGRRLADTRLNTWKDYLKFRFLNDYADYLPHAFDAARFEFYNHTLNEVPEQRVRWKRGIAFLDASLGEAVGQLYVERHWSAATAQAATELVSDLRAAYRDGIEHATWIDRATRDAALAKLATFDPRIGHPVKWIDYSTLTISPTDPLANALAAEVFEWNRSLARLSQPVDRGLWEMTPQTVNAYYDPSLNQITVPAAILQPPFLDAAADPAVNYGAAGVAIGHEMSHGFDDEGRRFDARGRLRDWWTRAAAAGYNRRADRLAEQFGKYEPLPGMRINGRLTLGENLADLGGLEVAYAAFHRYLTRHGSPGKIDGYTPDQRFFIAYAQSWQGKSRDGATRQQLLGDQHSPERYRVNGIVRNFSPWYVAFDVRPGNGLYLAPDRRVHIWSPN